ncbi:MAG: outer membrane protein assembly factor BamC [Gammaproteobacteria bacterium]|nr:outer membrane protein assembly factor BamC [Gammaproteobacteria bacterium]
MIVNNKITIRLFILVLGFYFSGCSTIRDILPDDNNLEYKNTSRQKSLDIPPDLTKPKGNSTFDIPDLAADANTYSAYHGKKDGVITNNTALSSQLGISFEHVGVNSWLVLSGTKEQIWPRVREFWLRYGFVLVVDKQGQGILETEWAENRAAIPKGFIRKFVGSLFDGAYSSNARDKFRMRIEQGEKEGTVELFLSHRGMVERVVDSFLTSEGSQWESAPTDYELEAKMLKRLMVDLGVQKQHAETIIAQGKDRAPKAIFVDKEGHPSLQLNRNFSRAWRLVGLVLDRVSFTVVDRNRSKGIYYVRYNDPDRITKKDGILSRLAFWSSDDKLEDRMYQVQVTAHGKVVSVVVNDEKGQIETSSTAERILKLLLEQLK